MTSQMRLTVDFETVESGPKASASDASTSRTDRPRTKPAITSDSNALVRVTPLAQQPGREGLGRAPQLRALQGHLPGRGLDRDVRIPVARSLPLSPASGVTVPAQELGNLGLQRGLEHQTHRNPGHLLEVLKQGSPLGASDQLIDLGADALTGPYS